jgi:hypothetical protein
MVTKPICVQARLVLGVKAELDSTKDAILQLYRR